MLSRLVISFLPRSKCHLISTGIKTIPMKKKCKKAKWLSEEALKIAVKRREVKSNGEKERYTPVHGIFQARILEWVAISFSKGSFPPRDQTQVSHIEGRFFTI